MLPPDPRRGESKLFAGEDQPQIHADEACVVSYIQECHVPHPPGPQWS